MYSSSFKLMAEIDHNTIRLVSYQVIDNQAIIADEEKFAISFFNLENEVFEFKNFVARHLMVNKITTCKIDLVYKSDVFQTQEIDIKNTLPYTNVNVNTKGFQTLLTKIGHNYQRQNSQHYIIKIDPYLYGDVEKNGAIINKYNDVNDLIITNRKVTIWSKVIIADIALINDIKNTFAKIGLQIGKIYSFAELISKKVSTLTHSNFVSVHLDKNFTYISDPKNQIYQTIDFGVNTFLKYAKEKLNMSYNTVYKLHDLYQVYLELNVNGEYINKSTSNKLFFDTYNKLLEKYWTIVFERIKQVSDSDMIVFSGNFNFMGNMKKIPITLLKSKQIKYYEDNEFSNIFNTKSLSCELIGKTHVKIAEKNLEDTFTLPDIFYNVIANKKIKAQPFIS